MTDAVRNQKLNALIMDISNKILYQHCFMIFFHDFIQPFILVKEMVQVQVVQNDQF